MFNKSRKKIIVSIMLSLILLLAVTLSVIMWASYREMRRRDSSMLERYVETYVLDEHSEAEKLPKSRQKDQGIPELRPNQGNPPPDVRPDYQLSTFYSVAFSDDGTVLAIDIGARGLHGEEELVETARNLLEKGKKSGRLDNLSYMVSGKTGYALVAFIDNTVTEGSMRLLLRNVLIVGGAAIIVLFFVSLFLSRQIIRPLEENDKQQKQFISDASHELKTPVAVISANTEILSRELGENEWLSNIQYENERMGDLVKQLLDLSRAENTETPMETIELSRVFIGEVLAFESLAFDHGKTIQSDIEEGIRVKGNQTQLTQLISVLLDNSIRHATGREIEVSLKSQGHTTVLSVSNEGDEIPAEKLEHLFDRFYRVDETRNSEGHHYGLGLSIAKAVVEKYGGNIAVSCKDGKIRFTVSIPGKN